MYDMWSIDSINRRHPVIQAKREVFIEKIRAFIGAVDDAY